MAQKWYLQIGDRIVGPHTPEKLREGAETGNLSPDTLVRLGEDGPWYPASRVKGLFNREKVEQAVEVPAQLDGGDGDAAGTVDEHEWHYSDKEGGKGPVSFAVLSKLIGDGIVTAKTQLWHDGLEDWTAASEIDGLPFSVPTATRPTVPPLKKIPPPLNVETSETPIDPSPGAGLENRALPVSTSNQESGFLSRCVSLSSRHKKVLAGIVMLFLIGFLALAAVFEVQFSRRGRDGSGRSLDMNLSGAPYTGEWLVHENSYPNRDPLFFYVGAEIQVGSRHSVSIEFSDGRQQTGTYVVTSKKLGSQNKSADGDVEESVYLSVEWAGGDKQDWSLTSTDGWKTAVLFYGLDPDMSAEMQLQAMMRYSTKCVLTRH